MQRWKIHKKARKNHSNQVGDVNFRGHILLHWIPATRQTTLMVPNMQMSIPRADIQDQDCLGAAVCDTGTWHQSLKKFGFKMEFRIILLPEYLIHYVSANPLLEAEGKSSWPLSEVSLYSRAHCRMKCNIAIYCPDVKHPLSAWHIQPKMRSMFQDKESFNHNENVILTDPRSRYINTVFKAFLIIQLTISAIPLQELKTKKLKGYWPIQFLK